MESGIMIRWGSPRPGRERESMETYRQAVSHHRRLLEQGKITYFEPFMFTSGDSEVEAGFYIVRGPVTEIFAMLDSPEYRELMAKASLQVEHFRMDMLTVGEAIERNFADFERLIPATSR